MKKEKMERLTKLQEMQEEESEDGEMQGSDDEDMDEEELTGLAAKSAWILSRVTVGFLPIGRRNCCRG